MIEYDAAEGESAVLRYAAFFYRAFFVLRSRLLAENLALREQLAVLYRQSKRVVPGEPEMDKGWLRRSHCCTQKAVPQ